MDEAFKLVVPAPKSQELTQAKLLFVDRRELGGKGIEPNLHVEYNLPRILLGGSVE